jgi:thiosulfate/3-mercaptopyruvate sulfurtransferase
MTATTLISANELATRDRHDTLVVDCRFDLADTTRGERDYAAAHIPGAAYAHLDRDLSGSGDGLGRHPLPSPSAFARTLARWGWRPGMPVVAYDDGPGAIAARLWWMMRLAGQRNVAVLDGGWAAWRGAGLPVDHDSSEHTVRIVPLDFDPRQVVFVDELQRLLQEPRTLLLDARAAARYRGEVEPIDSVAGHVPGARNRPFSDNLEAGGRFKPVPRLREEFTDLLGTHAPADVVHMCGSGVTACANLLAMEHAGLAGSRVFAPSWSGWISHPSRPVQRGDAP